MEFNKPNSLQMTGNLVENFRIFKQSVQIYFDATELHSKKSGEPVQNHGVNETQQEVGSRRNQIGLQHRRRSEEVPEFKRKAAQDKQKSNVVSHISKCRSGKGKKENRVDNLKMEFSIDALEIEIMNTELADGRIIKSWIDNIKMNGMETKIKLDTGAELNVISYKLFKQINGLNLNKSNVIIKSSGGYTTKSKGSTVIKLVNKGKKIKRVFEVVEYDGLPLLSFEACFLQENKVIFNGIGKFPDLFRIKLKNNSNPVCNSPRRVPIKIFDKLREQLNFMVKLDLIETCSEPSEWQSNLVVIAKPNGTLRICLDRKDINANVLRELYQIPTLEEIRPALANKKFYSLLELKDSFYHCELDEVSSNICTFSSPFGSYKFKRLPFCLSVAPEIFQKLMVKYFGEIKGVHIYFDDLLVCADTRSEHDLIIDKVTENARKYNIKFNVKKFQYCVSEVKFLGFIFNEHGVTPDPERIRGAIKKNALWNWNKQCQLTFIKLKEFLCNIPTLKNFDSKSDLKIQCDASDKAIGCCLSQMKSPIHFASRCLNENYEGNCEDKESDCSRSVTLKKEDEYISDIESAEIDELLNMINAKA
ncbi:hypothetical protein QTP88_022916 [Uroleucon formosanum]